MIGGTLPAALGADWMVSAWDQNAAMRLATPATAAAEEVGGQWLLELLRLPATSAVGFATGGTTANFVGLAAGRQFVLEQAGWDLEADGLTGAPKITVLVGEERHTSVDMALRYLGLGRGRNVAADDQGRILPAALAEALAEVDGPVIVALQAGNLHSGAFDPMRECIELAHASGAWVHVDGAFGLWAAVERRSGCGAIDGLELADSWATDAHKTLNVPYDCGVAIVARPDVLRSRLRRATGLPDPGRMTARAIRSTRVPEFSRRARGVPVWAALRSARSLRGDRRSSRGSPRTPAHSRPASPNSPAPRCSTTWCSRRCRVAFGSDERTKRGHPRSSSTTGAVWMSGSKWRGRDILRISVSNWSTDPADVAAGDRRGVRALRRFPDEILTSESVRTGLDDRVVP